MKQIILILSILFFNVYCFAQGIGSHSNHVPMVFDSSYMNNIHSFSPIIDFNSRTMLTDEYGTTAPFGDLIIVPNTNSNYSPGSWNPAFFNTITGQYIWTSSTPNTLGNDIYQQNGAPGINLVTQGADHDMLPVKTIRIKNQSLGATQALTKSGFTTSGSIYDINMIFHASTTQSHRIWGLWLWNVRNQVTGEVQTTPCYIKDLFKYMSPADSAKLDLFPTRGSNSLEHNYYSIDRMGGEESNPEVDINKVTGESEIYVPITLVYDSMAISYPWYSGLQEVQKSFIFTVKFNPFRIEVTETDNSLTISPYVGQKRMIYNQASKSTDFGGDTSLFIFSKHGPVFDGNGFSWEDRSHGGRVHFLWHTESSGFDLSHPFDLMSPGNMFYDTARILVDSGPIHPWFGKPRLVVDDAEILPSNGQTHNGLPKRTALVGMRAFGSGVQYNAYFLWEICFTADPSTKQIEILSVKRKVSNFQFGTMGLLNTTYPYLQKQGPITDTSVGEYIHVFKPLDWNLIPSVPKPLVRHKVESPTGEPLHGCRDQPIILGSEFLSYHLTDSLQNAVNNWSIEEKGAESYTIEHSMDDALFTAIGTVAAKGYGFQRYSWTHFSPPCSWNYYRIRINYADVSFAYTDTKVLDIQCGSGDVKLFPNPIGINRSFTIQTIDNNTESSYAIYSIDGKEVRPRVFFKTETTASLADVPAASYLVKITMSDGTYTIKKLIVQE